MAQVLSSLPTPNNDDLLIGSLSGDDACVWRLNNTESIVSTVDFITPIVDDARTFGRIAAANAVSDIYAMGARPLFALNIAGWNRDELPLELLSDVLLGGHDIAQECGFVIAGGHTIDDPEPKYGLAVTGLVETAKMMTNTGLKAGQDLILTKPLGVGLITTAHKFSKSTSAQLDSAVAEMVRTNKVASRIALEAGATGATDVTGFGLLGHLGRMCVESHVIAEISFDSLPLLDGALDFATAGVVPGGTRRNLEANRQLIVDSGDLDEAQLLVLADAQTSGGLVFGVQSSASANVIAELTASGHRCSIIGRTHSPQERPFEAANTRSDGAADSVTEGHSSVFGITLI